MNYDLLLLYIYIGSETIPLGFVHEQKKWMYIRDGKKNFSGITNDPSPAKEIMILTKTEDSFSVFFH